MVKKIVLSMALCGSLLQAGEIQTKVLSSDALMVVA